MNKSNNQGNNKAIAASEYGQATRVEFRLYTADHRGERGMHFDSCIKQATDQGTKRIGIVGRGEVHSFIAAEKIARQEQLHLLYGLELTIWSETQETSCIFYVLNKTGKRHLFELISSLDGQHSSPIRKDCLTKSREGLLIANTGLDNELMKAALTKTKEEVEDVAGFYDIIQLHPITDDNQFIIDGVIYSFDQIEQAQRRLLEAGERLNKWVIAVGNGEQYESTEVMLNNFQHLGPEKAFELAVTNTCQLAAQFEAVEIIPRHRLYPTLEGEEAQLRSLCYSSAARMYGSSLPDPVISRLELELGGIIDNGYASAYLISGDIARHAKSWGDTVTARGSAGSSLVAYCLGLTEINPLLPHYRCNACRHNEWVHDASGNGADLPDKVCPRCGETMVGDGHAIPCEMFMGLSYDRPPNMDLYIPRPSQARILRLLEEQFGNERILYAGTLNYHGIFILPANRKAEDLTPVIIDKCQGQMRKTSYFDYRELEPVLFKLDLLEHRDAGFFTLMSKLTGVDPAMIPMNDVNVLSLFRSSEALGICSQQRQAGAAVYGIPEMQVDFVRDMLGELQPTTYNDLLQICGLSHGNGAWEGNAQELLRSSDLKLQSVLAFREDVMSKLIEWGIPKDLAYRITEHVRRGQGIPEDKLEGLAQYPIPVWFFDACKKIKYLFPKAQAAIYVWAAIRYAYYKLNHPLEFYAVYFTMNEHYFDFELCMGGLEAIEMKLQQLEKQRLSDPEAIKEPILLVAAEMHARGMWFGKDPDTGGYIVENNQHRISIPVSDQF
ncbi:hypothetical protein GCM10023310_28100 [Paenibacillus vulneris]|uniref:PHP domain-containing protein n=1 Tax=Paenibacillus vulneris TaxID=1133364 RepID=A0ABW3USC2_9BACL